MPNRFQVLTCQQCGTGFVLTSTYLDLLERRQARAIVPVLCPTCFVTKGAMPKERGKVKWFNRHKHYGFIITEEGDEVFFHQRQILEEDHEFQEGKVVRFHLTYPAKGPEALNVELASD